MESVERLHQRVQGTGANTSGQGHGKAGEVFAVRPASVVAAGNGDVWSPIFIIMRKQGNEGLLFANEEYQLPSADQRSRSTLPLRPV